jgi:regulator of sirC expression with transglutaminase-like and TPR domain
MVMLAAIGAYNGDQPTLAEAMAILAKFVLAGVVLGLLPRLSATAQADPVAAPPALSSAERDAETYAYCMQLAKQDAAAAQRLAEEWQARGGAHPADHCAAVALIELGKYREAANRLETLARAMTKAPASLKAEVLDQASQAWLLAGDPVKAYANARAAVELQPADPELLLDRAETAASAGYFDRAIGDLNSILKADPTRADALTYRASAYRALYRLDAALADIDAALTRAPDSAPALLERGDIRRLIGNVDGARRDWQRVGEIAPGTPADIAARANLEHLGREQKPPPATTASPVP